MNTHEKYLIYPTTLKVVNASKDINESMSTPHQTFKFLVNELKLDIPDKTENTDIVHVYDESKSYDEIIIDGVIKETNKSWCVKMGSQSTWFPKQSAIRNVKWTYYEIPIMAHQ